MIEKEKIGGRAYSNGLRLMNNRYTVKAYYHKNNMLQLQLGKVKRSSSFKTVKKIPVLRGIVSLLLAVSMFLKESVNKPSRYWPVILLVLLELIYFLLPSSLGESAVTSLMAIYYSLPILLLLVFWKRINEVLKYHGAEHKVVNYYENECKGDISSYSRLHRRCGSNIVFYFFVISLSLGSFDINLHPLLLELLYLGLAYEAVRYTPGKLLFIPFLFQRLVTKEPDDRHLKAARLALDTLLEQG